MNPRSNRAIDFIIRYERAFVAPANSTAARSAIDTWNTTAMPAAPPGLWIAALDKGPAAQTRAGYTIKLIGISSFLPGAAREHFMSILTAGRTTRRAQALRRRHAVCHEPPQIQSFQTGVHH